MRRHELGSSALRLPQNLRQRILRAAETAYPFECCGLLVGLRHGPEVWVTRIEESQNLAAPERRDRFEVDPALQFALMRELRGGNEEIVGVYHSHPGGAARPSSFDLERAYDVSLVSVIVGLSDAGSSEMRAFKLAESGTECHEIPIVTAHTRQFT